MMTFWGARGHPRENPIPINCETRLPLFRYAGPRFGITLAIIHANRAAPHGAPRHAGNAHWRKRPTDPGFGR